MNTLLSLYQEHTKREKAAKNSKVEQSIKELLKLDYKAKRLENIQNLLSWDQEVYMPKSGVTNRSEQVALIEELIHQTLTEPRVPELLHELGVTEERQTGEECLPQEIQLWLRAKYTQWKKAASIPPALLREIALLQVKSYSVWEKARENDDYASFVPYLKKTVELQREKADCLGYGKSRYDALLNEYEHGITTEMLSAMFEKLTSELVPLSQKILERSKVRTFSPVSSSKEELKAFFDKIIALVAYTKDTGRVDCSTHPFSISIGKYDSRITTKLDINNPLSEISSLLHEIGHSFYDLGIADIYQDTVCDKGASYGIHESQSRFFEIMLGNSTEFWEYMYPELQATISAFREESFETFMQRLLHISPSKIRIDSNEVEYGLHIIVRFEIERDLIEERISVQDIPEIWREKMKNIVGIVPTTDREGVLQDVHWSVCDFGYFPSYELGNIYSATLFEEIKTTMPDYRDMVGAGNIAPIRKWLNERIHVHGASKLPSELLTLSVDTKIAHLKKRYLV